MKKVSVLLIVALLAGSCSLFEKPSMTQEEIDLIQADNQRLQEQVVQAQHEASLQKLQAEECAKVLAELQKPETKAPKGNFYVIAGSFKTAQFATDYASKMKQMGGEGAIIAGPSNFQLVTYSSHKSLREAVTAMEKARTNISSEAWVYMVK